MLRQSPSSSRSHHRSKKLRATSHTFQAVLLAAVAIWIVYQLARSYGEQRPVAVETGSPARRRLGRKGFVHYAGHASVDGIGIGIAGGRNWPSDGSSDDPLSNKAGDGEGDDEDREAAEDDGDVDDADDGLAVAADEEDDGRDFRSASQNGSREATVHRGTQKGLNISVGAPVIGAGTTVQDGAAAVLRRNAAGGAADGKGTIPTLRDRGTAGNAANSFAVGTPGAEEKPTNTGNSGHGISA